MYARPISDSDLGQLARYSIDYTSGLLTDDTLDLLPIVTGALWPGRVVGADVLAMPVLATYASAANTYLLVVGRARAGDVYHSSSSWRLHAGDMGHADQHSRLPEGSTQVLCCVGVWARRLPDPSSMACIPAAAPLAYCCVVDPADLVTAETDDLAVADAIEMLAPTQQLPVRLHLNYTDGAGNRPHRRLVLCDQQGGGSMYDWHSVQAHILAIRQQLQQGCSPVHVLAGAIDRGQV